MKRKPNVVLDTNIIVSALISSNGAPAIVLRKLRHNDFVLHTSHDQLAEIKAVLKRPRIVKLLPNSVLDKMNSFVNEFKSFAMVSNPRVLKWEFEDKNDHFLLDLVVSTKADFLVTGDKALRELYFVDQCSIVSPLEFIERL